jgi:hypothetical protein
VTFSDGTQQRYSLRAIQSAFIRAPEVSPLAVINPVSSPDKLPKTWDLTSYASVRSHLMSIALGAWTAGHITGIWAQTTMFASAPAPMFYPPNLSECVATLADAVRLPLTAFNAWPVDSSELVTHLQQHHVTLEPIATRAIDALHPDTYRAATQSPRWLIGSPSPHVFDLILFLAIMFPFTGIALLTPTTYTTHAPRPRGDGLTRLNEKGRLAYIYNPLSELTPTPSKWLVVFPDSASRSKFLQGRASTVVTSTATG